MVRLPKIRKHLAEHVGQPDLERGGTESEPAVCFEHFTRRTNCAVRIGHMNGHFSVNISAVLRYGLSCFFTRSIQKAIQPIRC